MQIPLNGGDDGLILGIDLGTQSLKALLYDAGSRQVVATAHAPLDLIAKDDGTREQQAAWWLDALRRSVTGLDASLRRQVRAIGVSGQQHGFVPLGADGTVLAPVKLWNDTSTTAECAQIHARLGGASGAVATAGNPLLPGYTASKILWLKTHRPQTYARLACILLPHDYLNYYLTGTPTMECGDASGTGLLDVRQRQWSSAVLHAIDPDRSLAACLPPLIAAHAPAGRLRAEAAGELGLPPGIVVAAGGGDNMMGAIGTGTVTTGRLTLSLGTSGTLYAYAPTPVIAANEEFAAFCDSTGGYLPLVCTMNCTAATELVRELAGIGLDEFEAMLLASQPGAGGIIAMPFFNGERTPSLPHAKGCFFGLSSANCTRPNLLRAVVEATVLGLRAGLAAMQRAGLQASCVAVTGGGARSAAWLTIVADALALRVQRPLHAEAAAFGAALQALWCMQRLAGSHAPLSEVVNEHPTLEPDFDLAPNPQRRAAYDQQFARYLQHVDVVHKLYP